MGKILVINNDEDTMMLLQTWLEKKSHEVKYTSSQEEGLRIIKMFEPQLVLIDVIQKDIIEEMKNDKDIPDIPIILMTGYTLRHKPLEVVVNDVIEKPFNLDLLEQKIVKLMS